MIFLSLRTHFPSLGKQLRVACIVLAGVCRVATAAEERSQIANGAMEGPFSGGLATNWVKNCYGDNEFTFAEETADVHEGHSAQRVTCTAFVKGGVQFHGSDIAIEGGKPYTLRLWMKGDVRSPVYIGIRKHGEPYTGYLKRLVRLKNEWRPYILTGNASGEDPQCSLYIMFEGTGTLLVDDVEVRPGIHEDIAESGMPPEKGNRIFNSGFEAGPEGWTPTDGFVVDPETVHSGGNSARLGAVDLPALKLPLNRPLASTVRPRTAPPGIECRPFPARAGMRYTLSAWIKAAAPDTRVTLRFFEWADNGGDQASDRNEHSGTVKVTTDWARYRIDGIVLPNMWEHYVARIVPTGTIWLDDVQIEEGAISDYRPARAVEVGAQTPVRWSLVGEPVPVTALVAAAESIENVALKFTLEDLWSRPLQTVVREAKARVPERVEFSPRQPGMYRVRVQADDSPATGEVAFGVFPQRDRALRPMSQFGTHVTDTLPEPSNTLLASAAMGARWVRLHDFGDFCHWHVVEPEKGTFVWHDAEINDLQKRGFMILANLGHPPVWAGRPHPKAQDHGSWTSAPPRNAAEWENYVFKTVEHFRDRIQHWEIWNEPCWDGFFSGTPQEYAELLKIAYRAAKRADPKALVIGGCFSSHKPEWTRRVLAQDSMSFMDALSYHVYWSPPGTETAVQGEPTFIEGEVEHFKGLMREYGGLKPIYMTEGGLRCPPFASWLPREGFSRSAAFGSSVDAHLELTGLDAACGLVRGMVQMISAGVTNICYYYSGGDRGAMPWFSTMANGYYVLMDYDGRPKPTMMAFSSLEQQLDGTAPFGLRIHNGLTAHLFSRGTGSVAVVWSDRRQALAVENVKVLDLMGNAMEKPLLEPGEPIYAIAPRLSPGQLDTQLHALSSAPSDSPSSRTARKPL